jgi:predicted phosphate transport protein (TIGR00153 family)
MPTTSYFGQIFGRSPFKPLQEHIDACYVCASLLEPLLAQAAAENWEEVERLREDVVSREHEADDLKRDIRLHLPSAFFLPVARADLLNLLIRQDEMANRAKDIAGLVLGRRLRFPEPLLERLSEFTRACVKTCNQARKVIGELDELVETAFRGAEVDRVRDMVHKLDEREHETDNLEHDLRAELFELEQGLPPVDVVFMHRLIDWLGDLADIAQRIGHGLELLLAK